MLFHQFRTHSELGRIKNKPHSLHSSNAGARTHSAFQHLLERPQFRIPLTWPVNIQSLKSSTMNGRITPEPKALRSSQHRGPDECESAKTERDGCRRLCGNGVALDAEVASTCLTWTRMTWFPIATGRQDQRPQMAVFHAFR